MSGKTLEDFWLTACEMESGGTGADDDDTITATATLLHA